MNANKKIVNAAPENAQVLGQFVGKCCDSNVFNNNDMHLGRAVFETLMASDEYKRAMENHHYIGFLGHPADSDCQDFEHACIVMKGMSIADNGEIEGTFDLVNTPVGRVVKSFIDAGVKFGISIRGLGEVDGNGEVDPDQFIFRGFDLVTFPAYDDCIPEFKAIAASTDTKKKAQFKKVCASINANLKDIKSCEALAVIQEQLPAESDEYTIVQDRIDELCSDVDEEAIVAEVMQEKLDAVTELYLDSADRVRELEQQLADSAVQVQELTVQCSSLKQKHAHLNKITASQLNDANSTVDELEARCERAEHRLDKVRASLLSARGELAESRESYNKQVTANTQLQNRLSSIIQKRKDDQEAIKASNDLNLKYEHKIEANSEAISQKDSTIEDLTAKLNETVVASRKFESKASHLDETNKELLSRVEAAEKMVESYQQAYANMYANALGVYLTGLPITASTTVEELTSMIKAGTSTANIPAAPSYYEEIEGDDEYIEDDETFDGDYSAGLVTL